MWPEKILCKIGSLLDSTKAPEHFVLYILKVLRPKWTTEMHSITSLIDFRNYAEDTWAQSLCYITINDTAETSGPPFELLIKELKSIVDSSKRRLLVSCFLVEALQAQRSNANYSNLDFAAFALDQELDNFFKVSGPLAKFRPLLKASRDSVEQIMSKINNENTYEDLETFASDLGLVRPLNLWPVLALWRAHYFGESEELFLHAPLPRVFGGPSTQYKDIERQCDFKTIARRAHKNFSFDQCVLAGQGSLAYRLNGSWCQKQVEQASLVCSMPGISKKVWLLNPKVMKASIFDLSLGKNILEFDLPGAQEEPNWIDCQRDVEGSLVLLWATLNTFTGSASHENMVAFDEDLLAGTNQGDFLQQISTVPQRRQRGTRLDFRDHGSLVNVHHSVKDQQGPQGRLWTHIYEVIYANTLLMTLETDSRPIEAVYGSPFDIVLLSPLSSKQALQHWRLGQDNKFAMIDSSPVPKSGTQSGYQSLSVYF